MSLEKKVHEICVFTEFDQHTKYQIGLDIENSYSSPISENNFFKK